VRIDKDPGPAREWEGVQLGWQYRWYRDWTAVWSELETEWRLMLRDAPSSNPYHLPEFVRAWSRAIGAHGVTPLIGVFHHLSGHRVLLPWVVVRHEGRFVERRILEFAGRELSGYQAPLIVPQKGEAIDFDDLWRAIQLATEGECDRGLMRYLGTDVAPSWARPMGEATPVLDLTTVSSLEDLLSRCSQNHRGDVRRRIRRLRERGDVEFWAASSTETTAVASDLRERFLVQHAIVCREKGYPDPFARPEAGSFLQFLFTTGLEEGFSFYGSLRVGGESIAWILGLVHQQALYWWRPAYHSEWKGLSPGKVLLASTLEYAISRGWKKVHFHAGGQPYKLAWKPDLPSMSSVTWYPPGVRSSTLSWYDRLAGTR